MKKNTVSRNLSYSLLSNIVITILSILIILVLPKLVSVTEYGYWQLYLLYVSYVGIFHLGWVDGIYLRYGGKSLSDINKSTLNNQIILFIFFETVLTIILLFLSYNFETKQPKFIIYFSIINILILNFKSLIMYILQSFNKIREYSVMVIIDRIIFLIVFLALILIKKVSIEYLMILDIFSKFLSALIGVYYIRVVFSFVFKFEKIDFIEVYKNMSSGIKLLMSYLCSIFIIGISRLNIVSEWGIATFAKISLTLSISNFLLVLINSIGVVLYPIIRKVQKELLPSIYLAIRDVLMSTILLLLLGYYPLKYVLNIWLPDYYQSIYFMAILFPMCLYEGKMYLLVNTYLKCLRKEKILMKVNIVSLLLSIFFSFVSTKIFHSLNLAVVSILVVLATRCILAEVYILYSLKIKSYNDIFYELLLTVIFICSSWFLSPLLGSFLYLIFLLLYLFLKKSKIVNSLVMVKELLKKEI
ncbi:MATE family efflux transporter [Vagococcus hydrophili]|uniref:Oligosaccharide flippase family protein n=1 Tax=Vagococcus hydrophili TaxID=2714947 RepID=A0A6G8AQT2_9ENTE|nr:oligosaccharide flippase family protein [Vagococcus hydrophili]QIL47424.1 oligosaccharide flippase family protein [Vagococcus hydrophili]